MGYIFANDFAEKIFNLRYTFDSNETWEQACRRVADHIARAEDGSKFQKYSDEFYSELADGRFMPGGRIWYGSGRNKAQLINCVSGETLIHTRNGLIPAKDLAGKEIEVLSEGGIYRKAKWNNYGKQELFSILLSNGDELFATEKHEWKVSKKKGGYENVTTLDLAGRHIPMQHILNFEYDDIEFKKGIQHGITFGDGALYMDGRYSQVPQFGDSQHLILDYFEKHSYQSSISALVARHLPATFKNLPSLNENKSYIRGFIAGFIAADGCVDNRGSIMVHQANLEILIKVRKLAASVGLPTTSLKLVRQINPFNGEDAPLYKLAFVKQAFDEKMLLKNKHLELFKNSPRTTKQQTIKVISVKSTFKTEDVFCCVEPETHTFVIESGYLTKNCFVLPSDDSREGWGKLSSDTLIVSGTGGGVGINYSYVRPRGTPIQGTGGTATGAVSLMRIINSICEEIKAGGGRRSALMFCLNHNHPDVLEFLDAKLDKKQINNANISIVFMDESPEDFFNKVKNDLDHELVWKGKVVKTIKARELWNRLIDNALENGEPGILNGHLANEMNNIHYARKLVSTNPCGEIFMQPYSVCCLGAVVLPRFVKMDVKGDDPTKKFDWEAFHKTISSGIRFLDNVLTVNYYPIPETEIESKQTRRVGLGVMGLHDMLLLLGLKYSSEEGRAFVDKVMAFMKHAAYDASTYLAVEKGPFPLFDSEQFLKSGFVKTLKPSIRNKIRAYGMRNCAVLTIAPTGTTSIVQGVSSGIEPIFAAAYWRLFKDDNLELHREVVVHKLFEDFVRQGKDTSHFEASEEINPEHHFAMQAVCQRHVDNAISKTVNIPKGMYTRETFSEMYMRYIPLLKGTTIYPMESRDDNPLTAINASEAIQYVLNDNAIIEEEQLDNCASGVCGL